MERRIASLEREICAEVVLSGKSDLLAEYDDIDAKLCKLCFIRKKLFDIFFHFVFFFLGFCFGFILWGSL